MIYVIAYYIISTLVYFIIGGGSAYWHAFNMLSVLGSSSVFMYLLGQRYKLKGREYAWLEFACIMTFGRMMWTVTCSFAPYDWIYSGNKYFFIIFTTWATLKMLRQIGGRH